MTVDLATALGWLEEARTSHVAWRDHVAAHGEDCCNDPIKSMDWTHEQKWIDRYDALIALLRVDGEPA